MNRYEYGKAYQTGFDRTVRFLISKGARRDGAQEAAQAAWVRGWERLNQLRSDTSVFTWINSIALNFYRGVIGRETLYQPLPDLPSRDHIDVAAIDVDRVLLCCRPAERRLLQSHMEGGTMGEIAREIGVTETAIRIRKMRARRAARSHMERRPRSEWQQACSSNSASGFDSSRT
jgi:DNA-directed RNA polymerase specialized sigma24 family protein